MTHRAMSPLAVKAIGWFGKYVGGAQARIYRATGGRLANTLKGAPVLLLTTTGHKTKQARTVPLLYLREGERFFIVASKGGVPKHPAWYVNLSADPNVRLQIGTEQKSLRARTLTEAEKARVWPKLVAMYADYQVYQDRCERSIPVVALE